MKFHSFCVIAAFISCMYKIRYVSREHAGHPEEHNYIVRSIRYGAWGKEDLKIANIIINMINTQSS